MAAASSTRAATRERCDARQKKTMRRCDNAREFSSCARAVDAIDARASTCRTCLSTSLTRLRTRHASPAIAILSDMRARGANRVPRAGDTEHRMERRARIDDANTVCLHADA
jgi:hypothetical protein